MPRYLAVLVVVSACLTTVGSATAEDQPLPTPFAANHPVEDTMAVTAEHREAETSIAERPRELHGHASHGRRGRLRSFFFGPSTGGAQRGTLPRGRRYINGRYYGNLNNRFYGPQYGYF